MRALLVRLKFPLLGKELVEQAARKRTYAVRVVYAVLLFGLFLVHLWELSRNMRGSMQNALGSGRELCISLMVMQTIGIVLFLPGLMAGAIAEEKERGSLALLFLTDLRPWELTLQKYFGRLIPVFTFLLLSLPMLAICYAFGGLSDDALLAGIYILVVLCLFVGALALLCSAWARTTSGAFLLAYGLVIGLAVVHVTHYAHYGVATPGLPSPLWVIFSSVNSRVVIWTSWPAVILTLVLLVLANVCLPHRAFVPARYRFREWFHKLDQWFMKANEQIGGIVFSQPVEVLPDRHPVAWRETTKRSAGKPTHLLRLCLMITAPAMLIGLSAAAADAGKNSKLVMATVFCTWLIVAFILVVQGANAFAAERAEQTLDVLLTTPLRAADIVREKMSGLRRLMGVLAIPLVILLIINATLTSTGLDGRDGYLIVGCGCIAIYLPAVTWLGVWVGLRTRKHARMSLAAVVALVGWCVVPLLVTFVLAVTNQSDSWAWLALPSPATGIVLTEFWEWPHFPEAGNAVPPVIVNFCFHGIVLYSLRRRCLRHADQYLRGERSAR